MYEHLVTPRRVYYGLAIGVFVLGMAIFALFLLESLSSLTDDLSQFVVPGSYKTELLEVGTYTIFYEYNSVVGDEIFSTPANLPGIRVRVASTDGELVPLRRPSASSNYSLGGRSGFAAREFDVTQPSRYSLSAEYTSGVKEPRVVLALGHNFSSKLIGTIFIAIAIAFVSFGIAAAIAIVTWRKRKKSRELLKLRFAKKGKPGI